MESKNEKETKKNNEVELPIQLKIEEAKQELINSINRIFHKYDLDYYFLHITTKDIYTEIENKKNIELSELRQNIKNKEVENGNNN